MTPQLEKQLLELAPRLFADRYKSKQQTAMCWGFECDDGWYELLKDAAIKLEPLCKAEHAKWVSLEKKWYEPIRRALYWFADSPFGLYAKLYKLAVYLVPDLYNPFYWYGGGPRASQIKEKFGTLRFYMTCETPEMSDIIREAELRSRKTCEQCGKLGKIRGKGWLYTCCAKCWKKMTS